MANETKDTKSSRKELARKARHAAYQQAKAWQANDPKHLAMKEAAKQHRREVYQVVKDRKKRKRKEKKTKADEPAAKQVAADEELMKMVRPAAKAPEQ